jgi:putative ATP-dependent endonuclease of the OLD family
MEEADPNLYPLDLSGITFINTEGDGNLDAMGSFFQGLDLKADSGHKTGTPAHSHRSGS